MGREINETNLLGCLVKDASSGEDVARNAD